MQSSNSHSADAAPVLRVKAQRIAGIRSDPWPQILQLLDTPQGCTEQQAALEHGTRRETSADHRDPDRHAEQLRDCKDAKGASSQSEVTVTLLERLSATSVVLRWCSDYCHYGEQIWICRMARSKGVCAISGSFIKRGDTVYCPRRARGRLHPVNADAMIHPRALVERPLATNPALATQEAS
jgi:hypothetical protein